jgi:hypothetical protein
MRDLFRWIFRGLEVSSLWLVVPRSLLRPVGAGVGAVCPHWSASAAPLTGGVTETQRGTQRTHSTEHTQHTRHKAHTGGHMRQREGHRRARSATGVTVSLAGRSSECRCPWAHAHWSERPPAGSKRRRATEETVGIGVTSPTESYGGVWV